MAETYMRLGQTLLHTIQTNGTKLDDEWISFFKQHNSLVDLRIDGPKAMYDAYRVNKGGEGAFHPIVPGWQQSFISLPACKHNLWI
jgi:uncharacterized protein